MKRRWAITILCLLYLSITTVLGVLHDHDHDHDGNILNVHNHCVACLLQLNGVTDLPIIVTAPSGAPVEFTVLTPDAFPISVFFSASSASRAPPAASA